jgi:hypothetical protein
MLDLDGGMGWWMVFWDDLDGPLLGRHHLAHQLERRPRDQRRPDA